MLTGRGQSRAFTVKDTMTGAMVNVTETNHPPNSDSDAWHAQISPDGTMAICVFYLHTVAVWQIDGNELLASFPVDVSHSQLESLIHVTVAIPPDNTVLAVLCVYWKADAILIIYDVKTSIVLSSTPLDTGTAPAIGMSFSPSGLQLVVQLETTWTSQIGYERQHERYQYLILGVDSHSKSPYLVDGGLWDDCAYSLDANYFVFCEMWYGRRIFVCTRDASGHYTNRQQLSVRPRRIHNEPALMSLALNQQGSHLAISWHCSPAYEIEIWDVVNDILLSRTTWNGEPYDLNPQISFSSDGTGLIGSFEYTLRVWDVQQLLGQFSQPASSVKYSHYGLYVATIVHPSDHIVCWTPGSSETPKRLLVPVGLALEDSMDSNHFDFFDSDRQLDYISEPRSPDDSTLGLFSWVIGNSDTVAVVSDIHIKPAVANALTVTGIKSTTDLIAVLLSVDIFHVSCAIVVIDRRSGLQLWSSQVSAGYGMIAFSPDGNHLFCTCVANTYLYGWDAQTGRMLWEAPSQSIIFPKDKPWRGSSSVNNLPKLLQVLHYTPSGHLVAQQDAESFPIHAWNAMSGQLLRVNRRHLQGLPSCLTVNTRVKRRDVSDIKSFVDSNPRSFLDSEGFASLSLVVSWDVYDRNVAFSTASGDFFVIHYPECLSDTDDEEEREESDLEIEVITIDDEEERDESDLEIEVITTDDEEESEESDLEIEMTTIEDE